MTQPGFRFERMTEEKPVQLRGKTKQKLEKEKEKEKMMKTPDGSVVDLVDRETEEAEEDAKGFLVMFKRNSQISMEI